MPKNFDISINELKVIKMHEWNAKDFKNFKNKDFDQNNSLQITFRLKTPSKIDVIL